MAVQRLKENVFSVGAIDWERRLFDELIPLPEGTSYNSYLIKGTEKTALLDTVDPAKTAELLGNLKELKIEKIDYLIAQHAEQDHSGSIPKILELFPMARVVTNQKCQGFLQELLPLSADKFIIIKDRETLSLGDKTLEFILAPWVHWPETMFTYLREDQILFTCDFTGSHLATSELFAEDDERTADSAKRYFAEIMMPFRTSINSHLAKIKDLPLKMIAPSHGPVYGKPAPILSAYGEWSSDRVKNEVVIPYVSMHGSVKVMTDHLIGRLIERGIEVKPFDLPKTDLGELAKALVDAATVVVGTSTILSGAHPLAANAAFLINALRPKTRYFSLIGSFGWGGKMVEQITGLLSGLKVEIIPPVMAKGAPKEADFLALDQLAETIFNKHKEII